MARIEVINGVERRRRWSFEEKRALVAVSYAPGAVVRDIARRADVRPNQIYRWRRELGGPISGFSPVIVASPVSGAISPPALTVEAMMEVVVNGEVRVRIPAATSPELAASVIAALMGSRSRS
jgi:transposase